MNETASWAVQALISIDFPGARDSSGEALEQRLDGYDKWFRRARLEAREKEAKSWYALALLDPRTDESRVHQSVRYFLAREQLREPWVRAAVEACWARHPNLEVWRSSDVRTQLGMEVWPLPEFVRRRDQAFLRRPKLGVRGSLWSSGQRLEPAESYRGLAEELRESTGQRKMAIVRWAGETGGESESRVLSEELQEAMKEGDEPYQLEVVAGLADIGGVEATSALLQAAECGSERLRTAALSGIDDLASIGSVALMERSDARVAQNEREAQLVRAALERVESIAKDAGTTAHVRHRAEQTAEFLRESLAGCPARS